MPGFAIFHLISTWSKNCLNVLKCIFFLYGLKEKHVARGSIYGLLDCTPSGYIRTQTHLGRREEVEDHVTKHTDAYHKLYEGCT